MKPQKDRPLIIKFGFESDIFLAKLVGKTFLVLSLVAIIALVKILINGVSYNNLIILVGAIISGIAIWGYLSVIMCDVKVGRIRKSLSSMLIVFCSFLPYLFGSYLFFYKGLWKFTLLINGFEIGIMVAALFYLFAGYIILLGGSSLFCVDS